MKLEQPLMLDTDGAIEVDADRQCYLKSQVQGPGILHTMGEGTLIRPIPFEIPLCIHEGCVVVQSQHLTHPTINEGCLVLDQSVEASCHVQPIQGHGRIVKRGPFDLSFDIPLETPSTFILDEGKAIFLQPSTFNNIENNGTLIFKAPRVTTIEGDIEGQGSIEIDEEQVILFKGHNTYLGSTIIKKGKLVGSTKSFPGDIENQGCLQFHQTQEGRYEHDIRGDGEVEFHLQAPLYITKPLSYRGETVVRGGGPLVIRNLLPNTAITNDGHIVWDVQEPTVHQQPVRGKGHWTKMGPSCLTMDAPQSSTGVTSLLEGALAVKAADQLGSAQGDVVIGSARLMTLASFSIPQRVHLEGWSVLDVADQVTTTLQLPLQGTGTLVKEGEGVLILPCSNHHRGVTMVSGGSLVYRLQERAVQRDQPIWVDTLLTFDTPSNTVVECLGSIGGKGSLLKEGLGTLILRGPQGSKEGQLHIQEGVVIASPRALSFFVHNASDLFLEETAGSILQAKISGGGRLVKRGEGHITLAQVVEQGAVVVEEGSLAIAHRCNAKVVVNPKAILLGSGTIEGGLSNQGTVSPGHTIGKLTVEGQYIQMPDATLQIHVNPYHATLLKVKGQARFAGSKLFCQLDKGRYPNQTLYTILEAEGGIFGDFQSAICSLPAFSIEMQKKEHMYNIVLRTRPWSEIVRPYASANTLAMASVLERTGGDPWEDLIQTLQFLESAPLIAETLDQLHFGSLRSIETINLDNGILTSQVLFQKLDPLQGCDSNPHTSVWIDPLYQYGHHKDRDLTTGYDSHLAGVFLGAEKQLTSPWIAGFFGSFTHQEIRWDYSEARGDIEHGWLGIYGQFVAPSWYFRGELAGGYHYVDVTRSILLPGSSQTTMHQLSVYSGQAGWEAGFGRSVSSFQVRPFVGMQGGMAVEDSYKEQGSSFDLHVDDHTSSMVRSEGGLHCTYVLPRSRWTPHLKLNWAGTWHIQGDKIDAHFQSSPDAPFTLRRPEKFRQTGVITTSLRGCCLNNKLTLELTYQGEFGSHSQTQTAHLHVAYLF
jgi:outer membrane autotransporter protein